MNDAADPGWRPALHLWWHLLVPLFPLWGRRRKLDLIGLRHLYLHTGIGLLELCLVTQWTFDATREDIPAVAWLVAGVIVAWDVGALVWVGRSGLPTAPAEELADRFRARSFIQLGLALAPGLYGIAGSYLFNRPDLSWLGAGIAVLLFATVAPTRSRLDRIDDELRATGSGLTIRDALSETV